MSLAIKQVIVPRYHQLVHTGQIVDMSVEVVDQTQSFSQLIDASEVTITLYNPVGTKLVTEVPLTRTELGVFETSYQTRASSIRGVYTATFNAVLSDVYARVDKISVFKVVKLSSFETFTVQGVLDQLGTLWYWYIDDAGLIVVTTALPDFVNLLAVEALGTPYWINLDGKYIYPLLDGNPDVSLSQPGVGTGVDTSPEFIGTDTESYELEVNQANEIEVVQQ